jgi:hypothetical protein
MALNVTAAQGASLKLGNAASPEVFTAIEGVFDGPQGIGFTPQIIEARFHSSTAIFKKVNGVDTGQLSFSIYYDSTNVQHTGLETAAKNKTRKNFQLIFTDAGAAQYAFGGYIGFEMGAPVEGFNTARVTVTVDGDITIT